MPRGRSSACSEKKACTSGNAKSWGVAAAVEVRREESHASSPCRRRFRNSASRVHQEPKLGGQRHSNADVAPLQRFCSGSLKALYLLNTVQTAGPSAAWFERHTRMM